MERYKYTSEDKEIITDEEQNIIVNWVKNNYNKCLKKNNYNCYKNNFDDIKKTYNCELPSCLFDIKRRIIEKEKLNGFQFETNLGDTIGYMINGGQLHKHTDPNKDGLIHTRYNVYVQIPEKGGYPIYDGVTLKLKEKTYICCRSGLDLHYCEKVEGERERIILSYGFYLPYNRVANIEYNYI